MKCPICNFKNIKGSWESKKGSLISGDKFDYKQRVYICQSCGFDGPVKRNSPSSYEKNKKNAVKGAIKNVVAELHKTFLNLLYIERALDLPRRTLSRWKSSGESSASSLVLLKLIQTFPFLLSVAESQFDREIANKALLEAAIALNPLAMGREFSIGGGVRGEVRRSFSSQPQMNGAALDCSWTQNLSNDDIFKSVKVSGSPGSGDIRAT